MNKKITTLLAGIFISLFTFAGSGEAQSMNNQTLSAKQQSIIPIAAFTAKGDMEKLKVVLNEGLDTGLTINEIKEVLVQMYAYTGFPRSLNGLNALLAVLDERQARGVKDVVGKDASPLPQDRNRLELGTKIQTGLVGRPVSGRTYDFAPVIDVFLKEHLFADIFGRDILDFQSREIATVSALAALSGVENQLRSHLNVSLNTGLSAEQLKHFVSIMRAKVGISEADSAGKVLEAVLDNRK
jgi:alkylhydroperoxidase/carboxymuconolactone decarboxylase family protein YurZ